MNMKQEPSLTQEILDRMDALAQQLGTLFAPESAALKSLLN